ncbi:AarF/ABC1/UbiB kinase family protein [Gordonia malaquae]|uniref:ABC1 kinase family protein n=1 Tax=Gordonia malaquae TaxID=410332 RepID=UPI0030FF2E33
MVESGGRSARIRRGGKLGGVAARHAVRVAAGAAAARFRTDEKVEAAQDRAALNLAEDIVSVVGGMRGAAHKLGQVLAVIDVGISSRGAREEFARRLEPLFAATPPWNERSMMRVLSSSLGTRRADIVELSGPIAAASIGQVYRGTLIDGRDVAVKIKYPDVDMMVRADFKNLALFSRMLAKYVPAGNVEGIVDEVRRQILTELDFRAECASQREFAARFARHPAFWIPDAVPELCTGEVLVTEFVDGMSFDDACLLDRTARDRIGEAVYRFYCAEMFRSGRFSADPHPGNMIVVPDGRVAFLDFGLTVTLSADELAVERAVLTAILDGDFDEMYRVIAGSGFITEPERLTQQQLVDYVLGAVGWHVVDGLRTVTATDARHAATAALSPAGGHIGRMGRQSMVEGHGFGRRNELATVALLGRLSATGPWADIAREALDLAGPVTAMGAAIEAWEAARS